MTDAIMIERNLSYNLPEATENMLISALVALLVNDDVFSVSFVPNILHDDELINLVTCHIIELYF